MREGLMLPDAFGMVLSKADHAGNLCREPVAALSTRVFPVIDVADLNMFGPAYCVIALKRK